MTREELENTLADLRGIMAGLDVQRSRLAAVAGRVDAALRRAEEAEAEHHRALDGATGGEGGQGY